MTLALEGLRVIDADTHMTEAHDLWIKRAPAAFKDRVPQVKTGAALAGVDVLVEGGGDRLGLAESGKPEEVLERGQGRVVVVGASWSPPCSRR